MSVNEAHGLVLVVGVEHGVDGVAELVGGGVDRGLRRRRAVVRCDEIALVRLHRAHFARLRHRHRIVRQTATLVRCQIVQRLVLIMRKTPITMTDDEGILGDNKSSKGAERQAWVDN